MTLSRLGTSRESESRASIWHQLRYCELLTVWNSLYSNPGRAVGFVVYQLKSFYLTQLVPIRQMVTPGYFWEKFWTHANRPAAATMAHRPRASHRPGHGRPAKPRA